MELRRLEYFVALAREGSFTRAAARTHTSQPNLSKQIQELEAELGLPLVDRLGRRVLLTAAGEELLPLAEDLLGRAEEARARMLAHRGLTRGRVRLVTMTAPSVYLVPRIAARFGKAFPQVELRIEASHSTEVYRAVREGDAQVGLAYLPEDEPMLVGEKLFVEELLLTVPRGHPLAQRKRMRVAELADVPISFAHDLTCTRIIERSFGAAGIAPRRAMELASLESLRAVIEQGLGVALLPKMYLQSLGKRAQLQTIPLTDPVPRETFGLLLHKDRKPCGATRALIDGIREEVDRLVARPWPGA